MDASTETPKRVAPRGLGVAVGAVLLIALAGTVVWLVGRRDSIDVEPSAAGEQIIDESRIVSVIPKDGIPAIDDPKFLPVGEYGWLHPQEPVIAIEIDGDARAYPLQILTWHEVANDEVGGTPVAVTFCPLCNTAYTFERPEVDGKVTTFGVSGMLYNSNLLMYDRATESLWPQALGIAATGEMKGTELERVPSPIVSWEEFRSSFPDGQVMSRETGHDRRYGENPYPGYDDTDSQPFLFEGEVDGRLAAVERILGVETPDGVVAYPYFRLREQAEDGIAAVNTDIKGLPYLVVWKKGAKSALDRASIAGSKDVGAAFAFSRVVGSRKLTFEVRDGRIVDVDTRSTWNIFGKAVSGELEGTELEPADAHDSFWFDWAAFHPETEVWAP